jgi:GR25 family glycosyltransferase involved in LPS biosynthesis
MKNLGVDIVYILNRTQDRIRKETLLEELKFIPGLNYKIIRAVTGDVLPSIADMIKNKTLSPVFTDPVGLLTRNIIATALTHQKAYNTFLSSEYDSCLILEDDARFTKKFYKYIYNGKLEKINKDIKNSDYDIIYWGRSNYADERKIAHTGKYSEHLNHTELNIDYYGAHAYQVSRQGATKIMEQALPVKFPADVLLESLDLKVYSSDYSMVVQNAGPVTQGVAHRLMDTLRTIGEEGDSLQSSTKEDFDFKYSNRDKGRYTKQVKECRIYSDIPIEKITFKPRKLPNGKIVENWASIHLIKD